MNSLIVSPIMAADMWLLFTLSTVGYDAITGQSNNCCKKPLGIDITISNFVLTPDSETRFIKDMQIRHNLHQRKPKHKMADATRYEKSGLYYGLRGFACCECYLKANWLLKLTNIAYLTSI